MNKLLGKTDKHPCRFGELGICMKKTAIALLTLLAALLLALPLNAYAFADEGDNGVDGQSAASTAWLDDGDDMTAQAGAKIRDVALVGLTGESGTLLGNYGGQRYVVIVGRPTCGNTQYIVTQAEQLTENPLYDGITFLVFDFDDYRSEFENGFGGRQSDRLRFFSPYEGSGVSYSMWSWETYEASATEEEDSGMLPYLFIVDSDGTILSSTTGAQHIQPFLSKLYGIDDPEYKLVTFDIKGYYWQEEGQKLLGMVNAARAAKGLQPLKWDSRLEATAKQRAAELSVLYDPEHARPDGTSCMTAYPDADALLENIAMWQKDATEVNDDWTNSPHHYENMTSPYVTSFGAAMFIDENGFCYWVESFSSLSGDGKLGRGDRYETTVSVTALSTYTNFYICNQDGTRMDFIDTEVGESLGLHLAVGRDESGARIVDGQVAFTSSLANVASFSGNKLTAKADGMTKVTLSLKKDPSVKYSIWANVGEYSPSVAYSDISMDSAFAYTGKPITPKPTITFWDGTVLREGTDYTLSYSDNVDIGTAQVTATGKGSYEGSVTVKFSIRTSLKRLSGNGALDTMSAIVDAGNFAKGGTVVLASLEGYWDALTAAGIAGLEDAPVLMALQDSLGDQTAAQLKKLAPKKIIVCGGSYWIPDKVVNQAKAAAGTNPTVQRLAGNVAVNTAEKIASAGKGRWSDTAIVATVGTFQDALAAAPLSYAKNMPIYLAQFDFAKEKGTLAKSTIDSMKANGITKAYIAGGTYWLPTSIEKQLADAGIKVVARLAGSTAVETSAAIAKEATTTLGMHVDGLGVANVNQHYDALASAAFCGKNGSVLLLASDANRSSIATKTDASGRPVNGFVSDNASQVIRSYVFGGKSSVTTATFDMLLKAWDACEG